MCDQQACLRTEYEMEVGRETEEQGKHHVADSEGSHGETQSEKIPAFCAVYSLLVLKLFCGGFDI